MDAAAAAAAAASMRHSGREHKASASMASADGEQRRAVAAERLEAWARDDVEADGGGERNEHKPPSQLLERGRAHATAATKQRSNSAAARRLILLLLLLLLLVLFSLLLVHANQAQPRDGCLQRVQRGIDGLLARSIF